MGLPATLATEVHHIDEVGDDPAKLWTGETVNLCKSHHSMITQMERAGKPRKKPRTRRPASPSPTDADGNINPAWVAWNKARRAAEREASDGHWTAPPPP